MTAITSPRAAVTKPTTPERTSDLAAASVRERLLLAALLIGTAILYLTNITVNGNGNTFYAGAAWAGSRNWEALLFGSVDPSNFITVDKPPVSQWIMGLSGQIFGYSSASMLIPEALMGVGAVALMYAMVTRMSGRTAGLIAGTALALTPVAAMMFRFNNPDAAMVLLMTIAAYCTVRATAKSSMGWLALAGVALGFAFLAKMLEGLMVLPALGLVYLVAAPAGVGKRIRDLLVATVAMIAASGWYVLLTLAWPASSRPYLAGSTDNNFMNLVLGYNGLERIEGRDKGGPGGAAGGNWNNLLTEFAHQNPSLARRFNGPGGGMFGAKPGLFRLFAGEFGAEISFLIPMALVALVLVLALRGKASRTDMIRAGAILFGMWMLVDGIVLSYMNGTTHPYYTLAIAPPIAGLVGLGVVQTWRARTSEVRWKALTGRFGLAALVLAGGIWGFVLLNRESAWQSWLKWVILIGTIVAALLIALPGARGRQIALGAAITGVLLILAAPAAFAINGDAVAHTGGGPSIIPKTSTKDFAGNARGGMGGFGEQTDSAELDTLLSSSHARWPAAVSRTSAAAGLELNAHVAVMGVGGFMNDPAPSLAQFQKYVADKDIGYYLVANNSSQTRGMLDQVGDVQLGSAARELLEQAQRGGTRGFGGSSVVNQIQQWVTGNFAGQKVGNYTVYNLSVTPSPQPAAGSIDTNTSTYGASAAGTPAGGGSATGHRAYSRTHRQG